MIIPYIWIIMKCLLLICLAIVHVSILLTFFLAYVSICLGFFLICLISFHITSCSLYIYFAFFSILVVKRLACWFVSSTWLFSFSFIYNSIYLFYNLFVIIMCECYLLYDYLCHSSGVFVIVLCDCLYVSFCSVPELYVICLFLWEWLFWCIISLFSWVCCIVAYPYKCILEHLLIPL